MNERAAFLQAIATDVYDDTARLAFADWLDEHGEHDRAAFIRVQVELEPIRDQYEIPRAAELHARENVLERGAGRGDFKESKLTDNRWEVEYDFRRGFPDLVRLSAKRFVADGATLRRDHPTIRRVVTHCLNGWGERLAACESLRGLPELELACWYADDDMTALAASPHLAELQVLVLWLGRRVQGTTDANLCRLATKGKAWPNLRELVFLDPRGEDEKVIKKLVASANRSAKQKLARYERGYPELFPLAADIGYCGYPGRLPDGRLAVAETRRADALDQEPFCGWEVWTFDPDGTPRDEVLRVPLPPELLPQDWSAARRFEEQRQKVLSEQLEFVPAFIRLKCWDKWSDGPRRGHYEDWDLCGSFDDPENPCDRNGEHDPHGYGGRIYRYVRNGEFVVGHDAWADKTGNVHST